MKTLVSIRMRASKRCAKGGAKSPEIHISGAEGLYEAADVPEAAGRYIERALGHSRGKADKIVVTIECLASRPKRISSLPVTTVSSETPVEGRRIASRILSSLGVSAKAISASLKTLGEEEMRGAALTARESGLRIEQDRERGVRASRLGIGKAALKKLGSSLSAFGINTETVREAVVLASKVSSHKGVVAELCISDDPDYTTGYVASRKYGYVRIPNIKRKGSRRGGRVIFVEETEGADKLTAYLEETPVLIDRVSPCKGIRTLDEILDSIGK